MSEQQIVWYAVRTKPFANRGRSTALVGGTFEGYVDRAGRARKRRVKGTGQREFVIETILRNRGFQIFLPTKKVWRRKSKYSKDKHLVAYPLIVGWVFVGWPSGENRWADLFATNLVLEVAGIDGRPFPIPQTAIDGLFKRWGGQDTRAPGREQFMRTHYEFKPGDDVRVVEGPLEGQRVKVVDLYGPKAKVLLDLLGGEQEVEIDAWALKAA